MEEVSELHHGLLCPIVNRVGKPVGVLWMQNGIA